MNKQRENRLKNAAIHRAKVKPLVLYYRLKKVSYKAIAHKLNLLGFRNQTGKRYDTETVRRYLIKN